MDNDLEALCRRVDRLESVQEISRLGAEYCHGLDGRDMDRFLRIWHPEAEWILGPDVRPVGHAEIRELVSGGIWPAFSETHHWMSNLVIDVDGDTATGQCDIDATVREIGGAWLRAAATYHDAYERYQGRWVLRRRDAVTHFQEALG